MFSSKFNLHSFLVIIAASLAYLLAGKLALLIAVPPTNAVAFWPAVGISLALALKFGKKVLIGVFIGDLLLQFDSFGLNFLSSTSSTLLFEFAIAFNGVLSTSLSLFLIKKFANYPSKLISEGSIIKLLTFGGPVAAIIPALLSSLIFAMAGLTPQNIIFSSAFIWWLGDSLGVLIMTPLTLLFIALPGKVNRVRKWAVSIPVILTLFLVILLFQSTEEKENNRLQAELTHHASNIGLEINRELNTHINFTQHMKESTFNNGEVNLDEFNRTANSIRQLHPDIQALAWDVIVKNKDRLAFEYQMQAIHQQDFQITQRNNDGNMVRRADQDEYAAIAYVSPYKGNEKALGFDPLSNPELNPFYYQARDSGKAIISSKVNLVQGDKSQIGIITYLPIYRDNVPIDTLEQRQTAFVGNLAGIYYLENIIHSILETFSVENTHLSITDISAPNNPILLFSEQSEIYNNISEDTSINFPVEIGNRSWNIRVSPYNEFYLNNFSNNVWTILFIGMLFTAILTVSLLVSSGRKARIEEVVNTRTKNLNKAQEELRLLAITFESHEAIMISDANNHILRVNQAFTEITGYSEEDVLNKSPKILSSGRHDRVFYDDMWQQINTKGRYEGEIWNRRKNNEVFPERQTITVVKDSEGNIINYVSVFSDITEKKDNEQRILDLAFYDPLTSLPNRRLLIDRLEQEINQAQREHTYGTLIFLDLDDFKKINDSLGHEYGDELLIQVGKRLKNNTRETDTIARIGGDEFVILIPSIHSSEEVLIDTATFLAEKILSAFSQPFSLKGYTHHISSSMGITSFPTDGNDAATELLRRADTAMYKAKHLGKNTFSFYENEMQVIAEENLALEHDLRTAINNNDFSLNYQPQINSFGQTVSSEALLRWQHEQRGWVSPADFIPLAEESGLIVPIGQWVLLEACSQMQSWLTQGIELQHISVNVSPKQFRQNDFIENVQSALAQSGLLADKLMLEVTEGIVIDNIEDTIKKMDILKAMGIQFSIDDFGTGYSSLSYLKRLPIDELKIDQSFVRDITTDENDAEIVATIIAMALHLNLTVVAEGVEDIEQLEFLTNNGCETFQGYYYSRPLVASEFIASIT